MKIAVGCHTNAINKQHVKRWVDFHSQYSTDLFLVVNYVDSLDMKTELDYARNKCVYVDVTNWMLPPIQDMHMRMQRCHELMLSVKPDWYGMIATDEVFSEVITEKMLNGIKENAIAFKLWHLWGGLDKCRMDSVWGMSHTMFRENIRLYRNVFGNPTVTPTALHTSMTPNVIKDSKFYVHPTIGIIHYAFVDDSQWENRINVYGEEYKTGGGCPVYSDKISLIQIPFMVTA